jgi:UDP-N-acetyl-2-amino-2-deoxyglucuronate dehydrogenase
MLEYHGAVPLSRTAERSLRAVPRRAEEGPGGAFGTLHVNTIEAGSPRRIQIVGDRALLELTGDDLTITRFTPALGAARREITEKFGEPAFSSEQVTLPPAPAFGEGHALVHRNFYEAIVNNGSPRCDGASGRMSLELANAITLSSCTQRAVTLPLDRQAYSALLADLRAGNRSIPGAIHADI